MALAWWQDADDAPSRHEDDGPPLTGIPRPLRDDDPWHTGEDSAA